MHRRFQFIGDSASELLIFGSSAAERRRGGSIAVVATIATFFAASAAFAKAITDFEIRTLSTRPSTVTAGSVLIEVSVPQNVPRQKAIVLVNGVNVASTLNWD